VTVGKGSDEGIWKGNLKNVMQFLLMKGNLKVGDVLKVGDKQ